MQRRMKIFGTRDPLQARNSWKSAPCTPVKPMEMIPPRKKAESSHVLHKVPVGDSPYVKAKHVQLIDKDPGKAISLFWAAINSGDRIESALKDMVIVMKQLNRGEEGVEAIKSFRHLCSHEAQESLDNVLLDLYKKCGRFDEQIELLEHKLKLIEEGAGFNGNKKNIRSHRRKLYVSVDTEKARVLGNLAWAHLQKDNYQTAEALYREALAIEPDKNKQCNLAVCLIKAGRVSEAKSMLNSVKSSQPWMTEDTYEPYLKSYERACEMLAELDIRWVSTPWEEIAKKDIIHQNSIIDIVPPSPSLGSINQCPGPFRSSNKWVEGSDGRRKTENHIVFTPSTFNGKGDSSQAFVDVASISTELTKGSTNQRGHVLRSTSRREHEDNTEATFLDARHKNSRVDFAPSSVRKWTNESFGRHQSGSSTSTHLGLERPSVSRDDKVTHWRRGHADGTPNCKVHEPLSIGDLQMGISSEEPSYGSIASVMAQGEVLASDPSALTNSKPAQASSGFMHKKSWADLVEEDEAEEASGREKSDYQADIQVAVRQDCSLERVNSQPLSNQNQEELTRLPGKFGTGDGFYCENLNLMNIVQHAPPPQPGISLLLPKKCLSARTGADIMCNRVEVKEEACQGRSSRVDTGPDVAYQRNDRRSSPGFERNPLARRCLSDEGQQKQEVADGFDFDLDRSYALQDVGEVAMKRRRNRLRVFQEIAPSESPKL